MEFAGALAKVAAETRGAELAPSRQSRGWESLSSLIHGWNPALRLAAGLAVVILVAGASWLVVQNLVMGSRIGVLEAERHDGAERERGLHRQIGDEQRHAADLAAQLEQQHSQTAAAHGIASLILLPGLSRAQSRVPQLSLDASAQIAHIQIQLDPRDDFPRFRAELRTRRGQDVLTFSRLARHQSAAGYALSFDVPASVLREGDYELALKGIATGGSAQDLAYYYFSVAKR